MGKGGESRFFFFHFVPASSITEGGSDGHSFPKERGMTLVVWMFSVSQLNLDDCDTQSDPENIKGKTIVESL